MLLTEFEVVNEVFAKTKSQSRLPSNSKRSRLLSTDQIPQNIDAGEPNSMDEIADEYLNDGESVSYEL